MAATISFHNGTSVHRGHNRRDKWIADKESHIDPNGHFEIWHDEKLTDAYDRIFGQAVADYNAKQKRPDRKIGSYYEQIRQGNSERNMVYETIIGVYKSDASEETQREILRKVYEAWPKRYPQFEIVGAYYHADEEGEPHVHIDYVPVATGYKRGLAKHNLPSQNGRRMAGSCWIIFVQITESKFITRKLEREFGTSRRRLIKWDRNSSMKCSMRLSRLSIKKKLWRTKSKICSAKRTACNFWLIVTTKRWIVSQKPRKNSKI